jgi:hypothetical protein
VFEPPHSDDCGQGNEAERRQSVCKPAGIHTANEPTKCF